MIKENVQRLLAELPPGVEVVAAAKTRTAGEIIEALEAGVKLIGENYVQEAERVQETVGGRARWHFIGHLQTNKVKKAVGIFDMIETVDSYPLAREISKRCEAIKKIMPVLVEINSGREDQKGGVLPEEALALIREIAELPHLSVQGVMTMGPFAGDPEEARPYFVETRKIFASARELQIIGVEMKYLSMGMSNSYRVAIEEGANLIRVGTKIFGPRE